MAEDLTTVDDVKTYLKISATTYDTLLTALVTQVSRKIERDCQRNFGAANYIEFSNTGTRQQRAQVRNKPIISLNSVRWGYATALQISYSGTGIWSSANVASDEWGSPVQLRLNTMNTSGVNTVSTFNLTTSNYATCSQLVAGINGVSNYSATLMGNVNVPTRWLYPWIVNVKTGNATYTQGLGFPYIDMFGYIIDGRYGTIGFQPLTSMDYFFAPDSQLITPISFPGQYQGLCIDYRGGFETVPQDIALLAIRCVANIFNESNHDLTLSSERLGDYSYQMADYASRNQWYTDALAPYKRISIAGGMG